MIDTLIITVVGIIGVLCSATMYLKGYSSGYDACYKSMMVPLRKLNTECVNQKMRIWELEEQLKKESKSHDT